MKRRLQRARISGAALLLILPRLVCYEYVVIWSHTQPSNRTTRKPGESRRSLFLQSFFFHECIFESRKISDVMRQVKGGRARAGQVGASRDGSKKGAKDAETNHTAPSSTQHFLAACHKRRTIPNSQEASIDVRSLVEVRQPCRVR